MRNYLPAAAALLLVVACSKAPSQMNEKTPGRTAAPAAANGPQGGFNLAAPVGLPQTTASIVIAVLGSGTVQGIGTGCAAIPNDGSDLSKILSSLGTQYSLPCLAQETSTPYSPGVNVGVQGLASGSYVAVVVLLDASSHALQYGASSVSVQSGVTTPVAISMVNYAGSTGNVDISIQEPGSNFSLSAQTPVYRFYKGATGEHFYTTSQTEGTNAGFNLESVGFSVLTNQIAGSSPIYRCYTGQFHFVSMDVACEGYRDEGVYGFVSTTQVAGTSPLYRCYNSAGDHLVNVGTPAECNQAGYTLDFGGAPMAYVPLPTFAQ